MGWSEHGLNTAFSPMQISKFGSSLGLPLKSTYLSTLQGHYEGPRQRANVRMIAALDGLKRVFEPQAGLSARLRNVGLGLLNELPFAKDRIMQYAMGQ